MHEIDFVLTWVDGNDSVWQAQKKETLQAHYHKLCCEDDANGECRYRDMGLLKYWFRSVEKNAPWVNKIFFITCGQKPEWLNEHHHKLVLVNHADYMPSAYLPTFNANPIELNLHRIPALSEHFVLFNDDIFLLKPIPPEFFFNNSKPVLPCDLKIYRNYGNNQWSRVCMNDYGTIAEHFDIRKAIWGNRNKWFNVKELGVYNAFMNGIRYKINKTFSISGYEHIANPHLKSTFQEVWSVCPEIMDATSKSRFRSDSQVNQWLMIAWNLVKGSFFPICEGKRGVDINICTKTIEAIRNKIEQRSVPQLCLNDTEENDNPEYCFQIAAQAMASVFPEKSGFER